MSIFARGIRVVALALLLGAASGVPAHADPAPPPGFLNGYASTISGQTIIYQSYFGDATQALLARVTDPVRTIEWVSQPIPLDYKDDVAHFSWIAGYAVGTSGGDRHYDLYIDGAKILTFTAPHDKNVHEWSIPGAGGVTLRFSGRWYDVNGDYFGDMFLDVPTARYPRGHALDLKVVGEDARSNDWYMTFQYAMRERVEAQVLPALVRAGTSLVQPIELTALHTNPAGTIVVTSDIGPGLTKNLSYAFNQFDLMVPAVHKPTPIRLHVVIPGTLDQSFQLTLRPVHRRTYYVISHSHDDVGYSDLQTVVFQKHNDYLREVMRLIRETRGNPPEARFCWSEESAWVVENFLDQATDAERSEFIADVKDGSIALSALYGDELTGLNLPEELLHLTDYAGLLESKYGIRVDTAMISDVPGYSWSLLPTLAQRNIPYFSAGPNFTIESPYRGDRIGETLRTWGDRPFYWVSPSGTSRTLFWMAGHGYSSFHTGNMRFSHAAWSHDEKLASYFIRYSNELERSDYPYDIVQVRYTQPADNGPPDPLLPGFVRTWNAQHVTPKLILATVSQTMQTFERRYGKSLRTYRGDFTPYWTDGAVSTAREESTAREVAERLVQSATLAGIRDARSYAADSYYPAWRDLVMWHEHTWGAWSSTSDPDSPFAVTQWLFKQKYVLDADQQSRALLANAEHPMPASETVDVYNTQSWPRTDVVYLSAQQSRAGDLVTGANGTPVPSQRLSSGELAFLAQSVPALGASRFIVRAGMPQAAQSDLRVDGNVIENSFLAVTVDARNGSIVRLLDKTDAAEYAGAGGLNGYFYVPGFDAKAAVGSDPASVTVKEHGPLVTSFLVTSTAPGVNELRREIRLIASTPRVDLFDTIDKKKIRTSEAVHLAFPFAVPNGTVRLDLGWTFIRPGIDQLPGANKDFYTVNRWADVSNAKRGITLATVDAPLLEVGAMTSDTRDPTGQRLWATSIPGSTALYSYVMNNYWYTNYKADQSGPTLFRYSLMPHGLFSGLDAARFGIERAQPLLAVPVDARVATVRTLFTLDGDVIATSITPSRDAKALMIRIFNPNDRRTILAIRWGAFKPARLFESNMSEKPLHAIALPQALPPFGVLTIRAERLHCHQPIC